MAYQEVKGFIDIKGKLYKILAIDSANNLLRFKIEHKKEFVFGEAVRGNFKIFFTIGRTPFTGFVKDVEEDFVDLNFLVDRRTQKVLNKIEEYWSFNEEITNYTFK